MADDTRERLNEARQNIHVTNGHLNYHLELFGDELAKREGYKQHDGIEALHFFLMEKYGWLPRDVKSMSMEDLRFALGEEMSGWTIKKPLPKMAKQD